MISCQNDNTNSQLNTLPCDNTVVDLSNLFKLFSDSTRVKLLFAIKEQELCVLDLCKILDMHQSAVSHQLKTLRHYKVVSTRRDGRRVFYKLRDKNIFDILNIGLIHILHEQV